MQPTMLHVTAPKAAISSDNLLAEAASGLAGEESPDRNQTFAVFFEEAALKSTEPAEVAAQTVTPETPSKVDETEVADANVLSGEVSPLVRSDDRNGNVQDSSVRSLKSKVADLHVTETSRQVSFTSGINHSLSNVGLSSHGPPAPDPSNGNAVRAATETSKPGAIVKGRQDAVLEGSPPRPDQKLLPGSLNSKITTSVGPKQLQPNPTTGSPVAASEQAVPKSDAAELPARPLVETAPIRSGHHSAKVQGIAPEQGSLPRTEETAHLKPLAPSASNSTGPGLPASTGTVSVLSRGPGIGSLNAAKIADSVKTTNIQSFTTLGDSEPSHITRIENYGVGSVASASQTMMTRIDMPQNVTRQIAEALHYSTNRPVEITLSPEELGRVRLGLAASEGGLVVTILAERSETTDLIRRHLSTLENAFEELGYSDIDFAFGNGGRNQDNDDKAHGSAAQSEALQSVSEQNNGEIQIISSAPTGIDIRL